MKVYFYCEKCNDVQLFYIEKNYRICSECKNRGKGKLINNRYWKKYQSTEKKDISCTKD